MSEDRSCFMHGDYTGKDECQLCVQAPQKSDSLTCCECHAGLELCCRDCVTDTASRQTYTEMRDDLQQFTNWLSERLDKTRAIGVRETEMGKLARDRAHEDYQILSELLDRFPMLT